ncbi:hypothetical protein F4818DRAFT_456262 [Hypoxylon cercidicola]|nr:hypothetical protein F4818DRAFT_456262 [Hypoxylon cercidicola]
MRLTATSKTAKVPKSSKASKQAKACGLSINTAHNHVDGSVQSARGEENVAQTSSSILQKEQVEGAAPRSSALKTKAMTGNWRTGNQQFERQGGVSLALATVAPDKTEFQLTRGKKNAKRLSIDTDRASEYGVRRYRDTPIDPDFIFSAPITKKDYDEAHDEAEAHHTEEPHEPTSMASSPHPSSAAKQHAAHTSADIITFQSPKQFHWTKWDAIPQTAGLPVDRLRAEMNQVALKAIMEDVPTDNQQRFDALIAKLQKPRLDGRRRVQSFIDIKPPHWTKECDKSNTQCESPSRDSAISGVPDEGMKKGPMLNPQAIEFRSSISPDASSPANLNNYHQEEGKENSLQQTTFHNVSLLKNGNSSEDSRLAELNARILELMEDVKQIKAHQIPFQHYSYPVEQGRNLALTNQSLYSQDQGQIQGPASFGQYGSTTWPAVQSYNVPQHSMQHPQFSHVSQNMGSANGSMTLMQPSYVGPRGYQKVPLQDRPRAPQAPTTLGPQGGCELLPLHAQAQMVFGPKPVSKPRGDFRPGDPRAAAAQIAYENYLEQKRASDMSYAMQCRERQARRAERQRSTLQKSNTAPKTLLQGAQVNTYLGTFNA